MSYPAVFLRIKALLLDSALFAVLLISIVTLVDELGIESVPLKAASILVPLLLFEPLLIWFTGGSPGHHYAGIRVVNARSGRNLFVLGGVVRLVVKLAFGWLSLLTLFITHRHRSVHDLASGSVVVFKDESSVPSHYKRVERNYAVRPSIRRRVAVVAVYLVLVLCSTAFVISLVVPGACFELDRCTEREHSLLAVYGLIVSIAVLAIVALGLLCKLPGAFHQKPRTTDTDSGSR